VPPALDQLAPRCDSFRNSDERCHTSQAASHSERFRFDAFDSGYDTASHRFTKDDLRHAEVINQVDRKFIACRIVKCSIDSAHGTAGDYVPQPAEGIVILIDQHAADERVRVERFLKELCLGFLGSLDGTEVNPSRGVRVRELTPPRPILLTQHEVISVKGSQGVRELLCKWGIRMAEPSLSNAVPGSDGASNSESGGSTGYSQLLISAIPDIVGDKVSLTSIVFLFVPSCLLNYLSFCVVDSYFKEMSCGISSGDFWDKSKVESSFQIPGWVLLLKRTKTNTSG